MQKVMGYMRRAIEEFDLIAPGDRVAVAVSGGKDSMALLMGLLKLQRFIGIDYELIAISLDLQFGGQQTNFEPVQELCDISGVPYLIRRTEIGSIVFDQRHEKNPCSLCARMRRGVLHDLAKSQKCNKIALGHHYDDAVETFLMNLFNEGRLGCFSPKSYLSRKGLTMIRPLAFCPESEITRAVKRNHLPLVKNPCPVDGTTHREEVKQLLIALDRQNKGIKQRVFGAMRRAGIDGWGDRDSS